MVPLRGIGSGHVTLCSHPELAMLFALRLDSAFTSINDMTVLLASPGDAQSCIQRCMPLTERILDGKANPLQRLRVWASNYTQLVRTLLLDEITAAWSQAMEAQITAVAPALRKRSARAASQGSSELCFTPGNLQSYKM